MIYGVIDYSRVKTGEPQIFNDPEVIWIIYWMDSEGKLAYDPQLLNAKYSILIKGYYYFMVLVQVKLMQQHA